MKLSTLKFSLAVLFVFVSVLTLAQNKDDKANNTDQYNPLNTTLSMELFKPTKFQDSFDQSVMLSKSGVFLNESRWQIQSFLNDEDLNKVPVNRVGFTTVDGMNTIMPGGFNATDFGSQTFMIYKVGKTTFRHINSFDFSGNLSSTTFHIEL
ncbi:MAG: hypothetical protein AAFQ94_30610 [Bacteroidota bacterium]